MATVYFLERNDVNIPSGRNRWYRETFYRAQLSAEEALKLIRAVRPAMSKVILWRVAEFEVLSDQSLRFVRAFTRKPN